MCKGKKNCSCGCSTKKKSKIKESLEPLIKSKLEKDYDLIKQEEGVMPENDVERSGYQKLQNDHYLDYDTEVDFGDNGKAFGATDFYFDYGNFDLSLSEFLSYFEDDWEPEEPETKVFNAMQGGISESKQSNKELLIEKIKLQLTSNQKKDFIKQTRIALDALLSLYDLAEKVNITNEDVLDLIDKGFESTNEILTILVIQDSIDKK